MKPVNGAVRIATVLAVASLVAAVLLAATARTVLAPRDAVPAAAEGSEAYADLITPERATIAVPQLLTRKHAASYADPAVVVRSGETFDLAGNQGAWWRIRLADGNMVWAEGSGLEFPAFRSSGLAVRYAEDGEGLLRLDVSPAPPSASAPGPAGAAGLPGGVHLVQSDGGRWTFTVEGTGANQRVTSPDPRTIVLTWPVADAPAGPEAAARGWDVPIHDGEFQDVVLMPGRLLVRFQRTPAWRAEAAGAGAVRIDFRRELAAVHRAGGAVSLVLRGDGTARDAREGGQLWVVLPDTAAAGEAASGGVAIRREGDDLWVATGITGNYTLRLEGDELTAAPVARGLAGRVIAIDPGHGGDDRGAPGGLLGLKEKDVNLAVALALGRKLERAGARVVFTRTDDTPLVGGEEELGARTRLMDAARPDVILSIHHDWSGSQAMRGGATYWSPLARNQEASRVLAADIQRAIVRGIGVRDNGIDAQRFFVITNVNAPAALVELGFLSNPGDARRIAARDYADRASDALLEGLASYFAGP